ncbi:MAG: hypothetical protein M9921_05185 [Fimbriimonadaceae bacterium]|nr:hypothetical protein [Chthonomonadaceae bacterium]MCO5296233.1 hypothetical protein [Fimbriimonadaceae bacterium]
MILALLAYTVIGPAPLTLAIRGATVSNAVRQIGEATGLTLHARPPIQNQMVLIDVHEAPVEEVLEHLAQAVHGEWLKDGDARILTRSKGLQTRLEKAAREAGARQIDEHLQNLLKAQRPWTDARCQDLVTRIRSAQARWQANYDPAAEEELSRLYQELPFQNGLVQLLAKIGGARLSGLQPLERIVFSNQPNGRQHRLPEGCDAILRELAETVKRFQQEVVRQGGGVVGYGETSPRAFDPSTRVIVSVQGSDVATLRMAGERASVTTLLLEGETQPHLDARYPETPVPLSPTAQWIADWWESRRTQTTPPKPTEEIREYLLNPADHPRIGTLVYESLDALAAHDGRQWIAWIPSVAERRLEIDWSSKPTLGRIATALQLRGCELLREDGWLIVRHARPTLIEWLEKPLEPLQRFVRHVVEVGSVRFLDEAALIAQIGYGVPHDEVAMLGYPTVSIPINALVPLVGSFSRAQRTAAASPAGIAISQLAPPQVALAEKALYEQDVWPRPPFEVTDAYPNGIPRDTVFKLAVDSRDVAQPWLEAAPNARTPLLDIGQLVSQISNRQQGKSQGYAWDMANRYLHGTQNVFHLTLVFSTGDPIAAEIGEPAVFDPKPTPWTEFPEPFRSEIEKRLKDRG